MPDEITTASTASIKTIKNLKTDQIIYPVTKANAVYLNDNETTVEGHLGDIEGLLGNATLDTNVQTVTSAINELNTKLSKTVGKPSGTIDTSGLSNAYMTAAKLNDSNLYARQYLVISGVANDTAETQRTVFFTDKYMTLWNNDNSIQVWSYTPDFVSGDAYTISHPTVIPGILSSNKTNLYFSVTTPIQLRRITTVDVTALKGGIRTISGTNINSSDDNTNWLTTSGVTVTASKKSSNMITFIVNSSNLFTSFTNNTPVMFLGTVTFSFS